MQSSQGDPSTGAVSSWASALAGFTEKRVLAVLALGFSSGLPLALTFGTLSIWLAEEGVSRTAIGLFASVGTPYALKFLWAPVIDRVDFPLLGRFFGRRRGWMLATQFASAAAILALGQTHPGEDAWLTALLALIVATCSASQDIVIDAYRVEILERRLLPSGATAVQFGYRIAMLVSGAGALYLATFVGWSTTYAVMAGLLLVGVIATLANPEPEQSPATSAVPEGAVAWLRRAVLDPFADFLRRPGWLAILAFIVLYKFGDAFAGVMTSPFLIDIGFSKIEIANVVKVFGFGATMAGLVLGGVLMNAVGLVRSLWICGLLQLGSNLVFCLQAAVGADVALLALTIALENLAGGMGSAAFVAYLSGLCNLSYTATQYALLSAMAAFGRTGLSTPAGYAAEQSGWFVFFILSAVAAVPGLVMLWWLTRPGAATRPA